MPFLVLVLGCALVALVQGVAPGDVVGWFGVQVALCAAGLVVVRTVRGSVRGLTHDLALGGAVGSALLLPTWWAQLHLGLPCWIPVAGLVLVCLALPSARRRVLVRQGWRRPGGAEWSSVLLVLLVLGWTVGDFTRWTAHWQTETRTYYQDVLFNLSLTSEAHRALPLTLPQAAGEALPYHWFGNVAMAAVGELGRVPDTVVVLQLWYPFVTGLTALAIAAAGREVLRSEAAGAWAAWIAMGWTAVGGMTRLTETPMTMVQNGWASPSMTYAILVSMALLPLVVAQLRGELGWGRTLPLGALLMMVLTVAKTTALPVLGGGLLALAITAAWRRKWPLAARTTGWGVLALLALLAARCAVYGGSTDGLAVQPFSYVWRLLALSHDGGLARAVPRWVLDAWGTPGSAVIMLMGIAAWCVGTILVVWPGIRGLAGRDPVVAPLLLGAGLLGLLLTTVLAHPGTSEVFFLRAGFPYLAMATAAVLAPAWSAAGPRSRRGWVLAVCAGALAWTVMARLEVLERLLHDVTTPAERMLRITAYLVVLAGIALAAWLLTRRSSSALVRWAAWAVVFSAGVGTALGHVVVTDQSSIASHIRVENRSPTGPDQLEAAALLRDQAGLDDVVVTDTHCLWPGQTLATECDARSFWVTAFGGRRTLVSGWAYGRRVLSAPVTKGRGYATMPFWDQPLLRLNDRVIEQARTDDLAAVCRMGARWVLDDTRLGRTSPRLADVADLELSSPQVRVYHLRCG
ncbi:hypothetical protein [Arsenicicoccus bolidensis]|uniref:Glycosyltransferase RgtA/B/C/D-like domain-containing protein n=1 Tax=Arsenicicoccus bolidensis TaxID=229480 RepID=A0ABS9Q7L0_9MICO|nr:hypothetical protein [Arsenicicoccus bolidensis]MCG7323083.1 hypothetical protein [Arsenicicoccus bolidensis]